MRIAGVIKESVVDGPGIRFVIFAQGCAHRCPGCHNPQTHPFAGGTEIEVDEMIDMIGQTPLINGVTFSGGDPFYQAEQFTVLGQACKALGLHVMTYTGFVLEDILQGKDEAQMALLHVTDILVDGPYIQEQSDLSLPFRGSRNQRLIDVPTSLRKGQVILIREPA